MTEFNEGEVVIVSTGQAGTVIGKYGRDLLVLLANMEIWHGMDSHARHPQGQDDLDTCPLEYDRFQNKQSIPNHVKRLPF